MSRERKYKTKNYYAKVFRNRWRSISLILTSIVTIPLFVYTALPPVEIIDEVPTETITPSILEIVEQVPVNQTIQVPVNTTITVPVNITQEIELNRTIELNVTEGSSIFLASQSAPPLIDSDIILVVDTSGSMGGVRMDTAKQAISNLVGAVNQSASLNTTDDRVALVTFAASQGDSNWANDASMETILDYVTNQTHLDDIISKTEALSTGGGTDIWAGLNVSLQILLNSKRSTPSLQSIILLTDGVHQAGPWSTDVQNGNYTGFMRFPNIDSAFSGTAQENGPSSESPIVVARRNGVKIYTIGIFDENTFEFDQNFLMNISRDEDYGTYGDFFIGNDSLSITESFLKARDAASGWVEVLHNETQVSGSGMMEIFNLNVTNSIRRLKWDINWNNTLNDFNLTITDPSGTISDLLNSSLDNINIILNQRPKSIIIDFPAMGVWKFEISWFNISTQEEIKTRLASYEPPILIESVSQLNITTSQIIDNLTIGSDSILFGLEVTNRNPVFSYHNITAELILNSTLFNYTSIWTPSFYSQLNVNDTLNFEANITLHEPVLIEGELLFLINSSEGYFDAYSQPLSLDFRINSENVVIESYLENQTISILENQTIVVLENVIVYTVEDVTEISTDFNTETGYTYNRTVFNAIKWIGLIASFMVLSAIFALYIQSQELKLRSLSTKFGRSLFRDKSNVEATLSRAGVNVSQISIDDELADISSLSEFSIRIFQRTGIRLSPEDLIETASGLRLEQIADRLSYITRLSTNEVVNKIRASDDIDEVINDLGFNLTEFLDIISI
ncbi:MAG: vWA domain-containing protein, partial [Candidatus Kariarchaeaceae archaeon]